MAQPVTDDELWQRKQARRRLVGAIVLVLLVVVFLPWVLDEKPKPLTKNVDIQIPAIDPPEKKFGAPAAPADGPAATPAPAPEPVPAPASPGVSATSPGATSAPATTSPPGTAEPLALPSTPADSSATSSSAPAAAATQINPEPPAPASRNKPVNEESIKKPAPDAKPVEKKPVAASRGKFVVPLGTFSKEDNARRLIRRVQAERLPVYMERFRSDEGSQMRVRLGPFSSESAAERARKVVVQKGIAPGPTKVMTLD